MFDAENRPADMDNEDDQKTAALINMIGRTLDGQPAETGLSVLSYLFVDILANSNETLAECEHDIRMSADKMIEHLKLRWPKIVEARNKVTPPMLPAGNA